MIILLGGPGLTPLNPVPCVHELHSLSCGPCGFGPLAGAIKFESRWRGFFQGRQRGYLGVRSVVQFVCDGLEKGTR
jgi:hypothetical protein